MSGDSKPWEGWSHVWEHVQEVPAGAEGSGGADVRGDPCRSRHRLGGDDQVGSVGSSYDNALAESINGLYKTELIKPRGPWRTLDAVEYATAEWVDWFNHRRLYEYCGDIPPVDLETAYYAQTRAQQ